MRSINAYRVGVPTRRCFTTRAPLLSPAPAPSTAPASSLPKPRLDYPRLLSFPSDTLQNAQLRAFPLPADHLSTLSQLRASQLVLAGKLNAVRARQNEVGRVIKSTCGAGPDGALAKTQAKELKAEVKAYEAELATTESSLLDLALALPNFSHPSAPLGPEENATTLETFGPPPIPADPARDHVTFAQHFSLLDPTASAKATGASWPYLRGALALLEQALVAYATSVAVKKGYEPVVPPDVVKADIAWRCGFQPRDAAEGDAAASQTYHLANGGGSKLCLAGTSEIPLAGMFADTLLTEESLPRRVVGIGRAFRAEAGARGADTRGLYRVHQFTKVELFVVSTEEGSEGVMEEMRGLQKEIAEGLGLSVRVLDMPTEELGASAHRKYDMEAWMPGRGKWGEITSTSNCTDYQSRRLSITYRPRASPYPPSPTSPSSSTSLPFAHTLNGTAAAIPRLMVALLENGLRYEKGEGGEVVYTGLDLPKVLERFYVGGETIGEGKKVGSIRWV
ncbi:serine-tRNA ligase [Cryptococcus sp. DSM 104549]